MSDNSSLPVAVGNETFANDDVGGVKYPRVKVTWGPDGTSNDSDVATGKPLPIQIRSATGLIPVGEPTDAKSAVTDGTSATGISIWKQISASVQALVANSTALWTVGTALTASVPVVQSGYKYETVAKSVTAQVLGGSGATGDLLFGLWITPETLNAGAVTIIDNAISIIVFTGGTGSVSNLVPFFVGVNASSVSGPWKVTTGDNVHVLALGYFT